MCCNRSGGFLVLVDLRIGIGEGGIGLAVGGGVVVCGLVTAGVEWSTSMSRMGLGLGSPTDSCLGVSNCSRLGVSMCTRDGLFI